MVYHHCSYDVLLCADFIKFKYIRQLQESVNQGVYGSMLPIFNTASEVGYGAVIATMAGFAIIRDGILNISPNNPLISEAVAMSVLAGITGSSSGGLSIALQTLGEDYLKLALEHNVNPNCCTEWLSWQQAVWILCLILVQ